jgi:Nif-specific regulatory protein
MSQNDSQSREGQIGKILTSVRGYRLQTILDRLRGGTSDQSAQQEADRALSILREIGAAVIHGRQLGQIIDTILGIMDAHMGLLRGELVIRQRRVFAVGALLDLPVGSRDHSGIYSLKGRISGRPGETVRLRIATDEQITHEFPDKSGYCRSDGEVAHVAVPLRHRQRLTGYFVFDCGRSSEIRPERVAAILCVIGELVADVAESRTHEQFRRKRLMDENRRLRLLLGEGPRKGLIGSGSAMRDISAQISQVAATDATVLIRGASGTGKELVARAIVAASSRRDKPFVAVNCAAIPEALVESELFGHERGSFTGAVEQRVGRAEAAEGGTLFLDEIGDLTLATQVKLLRFLQSRTFSRVGSNKERTADVRFIAATSRNLEELMAKGAFREDLYYRLNIFPIFMPPLRERKEDILELAEFFVAKYATKYRRPVESISPEALRRLLDCDWPGNVRELENCIERAVLVARGKSIAVADLPDTVRAAPGALGTSASPDGTAPATAVTDAVALTDAPLSVQLRDFEKRLLEYTLEKTQGNYAAAARRLGLSPRMMYYRARGVGIDRSPSAT